MIAIPTTPGVGMDLDEDKIEREEALVNCRGGRFGASVSLSACPRLTHPVGRLGLANFSITKQAFCPPNPKLLDSVTSTLVSRATFGI